MKKQRILYVTDHTFTPFEKIENCAILCEQGKILAIGGESAFDKSSDLKIVDLHGTYALPGFIDTHIHGARGFAVNDIVNSEIPLSKMSMTLASHGVTSYLPTLVSAKPADMLATVSTLAEICKDTNHKGALPIGIHVEGPFISPSKKGTQHSQYILPIDLGFLHEIISAGQGHIKIMTFAPELNKAIELIEMLCINNIAPSMGHSAAMAKDVIKAVDAGAERCTHLFNGMPPLHQREPNLTTIALTDDRIAVEVNLDGHHLHPRMIDLACKIKPKSKIIGVSDSIKETDLKDGAYTIEGTQFTIKDGVAVTDDGMIAGGLLTLEKGWRHLMEYTKLEHMTTDMTMEDVSACVTVNPARDLNINDRGILRPGQRADIVFFDRQKHNVALTVIDGNIVYNNDTQTKRLKKIWVG